MKTVPKNPHSPNPISENPRAENPVSGRKALSETPEAPKTTTSVDRPASSPCQGLTVPFAKVVPGGNPTLLVPGTAVPHSLLPEAARILMGSDHIQGEQVGSLSWAATDAALPHLQMMGGEFCVNAIRASAALLANARQLSPHDADGCFAGYMTVSGADNPILVATAPTESLLTATITLLQNTRHSISETLETGKACGMSDRVPQNGSGDTSADAYCGTSHALRYVSGDAAGVACGLVASDCLHGATQSPPVDQSACTNKPEQSNRPALVHPPAQLAQAQYTNLSRHVKRPANWSGDWSAEWATGGATGWTGDVPQPLLYTAARLTCHITPATLEKVDDGMVIVHLPGISHLLIPVSTCHSPGTVPAPHECETLAAHYRTRYQLDRLPASGTVWYEELPGKFTILPAVYVKDTDTLCLETACGSASLALGLHACLASKRYDSQSSSAYAIQQPSGHILTVTIVKNSATTCHAWVAGMTRIAAMGKTYL